jgi:hypothetical protein
MTTIITTSAIEKTRTDMDCDLFFAVGEVSIALVYLQMPLKTKNMHMVTFQEIAARI